MPVSWTAVFRGVVLLLLSAHVFYLYAFARTLQEIVGLDVLAILASASFALVMLLPLAWAAVLPDLPEIVRTHVGRKRWAAGRCARCGHSLLHMQGGSCPECGTDRREPQEFRFGWATARRFTVIALIAWVVGCAGAEGWASIDEAAFEQEARLQPMATAENPYTRPRRWPMQERLLYYTDIAGVTAYPPDVVLAPPLPAQPRPAQPRPADAHSRTNR